MIERLLGKCTQTAEKYCRGIMRIVYGDIDAEQAIGEVESPSMTLQQLLAAAGAAAGDQ